MTNDKNNQPFEGEEDEHGNPGPYHGIDVFIERGDQKKEDDSGPWNAAEPDDGDSDPTD